MAGRRNSKRRDALRFSGHSVHETLMGHASGGRTEAPLAHPTFESMARQERPGCDAVAQALHQPLGAFVKWYVRQGNIRDGRVGLILALYACAYTRRKYRKALARRRRRER